MTALADGTFDAGPADNPATIPQRLAAARSLLADFDAEHAPERRPDFQFWAKRLAGVLATVITIADERNTRCRYLAGELQIAVDSNRDLAALLPADQLAAMLREDGTDA